jgi:hypothetical protein
MSEETERDENDRQEWETNPERFCGYCGTRLDDDGTCPADSLRYEKEEDDEAGR